MNKVLVFQVAFSFLKSIQFIFKESELELADLKRFIIEHDGEYLLNKYRENSLLSDPYRKALVALIVKKLTNHHSFWPTTSQKIKYAKLAVELLSNYKTDSENYYVSITWLNQFNNMNPVKQNQ